jgi:choline dehydrogenase-like flavoprotein
MSRTLLRDAASMGGRELLGWRLVGLKETSWGYLARTRRDDGEEEVLSTRRVFLCAGALQTPRIVSTLQLKPVRGRVGLHLNLKVLARFTEVVDPSRGTIFTHQVQDLMDEGMLFMASNSTPELLGMGLGSASDQAVNEIMGSYSRIGTYTAQVRPETYLSLVSYRGRQFSLLQLTQRDLDLVRTAVVSLTQMLFAAGCTEVWLPLSGLPSAKSSDQVRTILERSRVRDFLLSSVHAMSSLPMGSMKAGPVDLEGRLRGAQNIWVADASILPTMIGESPQGTIMAMADHVVQRMLRSVT